MPLMIIVQSHVMSLQLIEQIKLFLNSGHFVLLSLDAEFKTEALLDATGRHSRFILLRSMPVTWCGSSQVRSFLRSLAVAMKTPGWSYAINISGQCLLYRPLSVLESYFSNLASNEIDGLVASFESPCDFEDPRNYEGWENDARVRLRYPERNMSLTFPERTQPEWRDVQSSPIVRSSRRFAFHAYDDFGSRTLFVRPLFADERAARQAYVEKHGLKMGRAWFTLSNRLVSAIATEGPLTRTWLLFKDAFEPDEYLLHNILANEFSHFNIQNKNLHFEYGQVNPLSADQFAEIMNNAPASGESFFARKIALDRKALASLKENVWLK